MVPLSSLSHKLKELDARNTWDVVFDITSVRAGSFKMPAPAARCITSVQEAKKKQVASSVDPRAVELGRTLSLRRFDRVESEVGNNKK